MFTCMNNEDILPTHTCFVATLGHSSHTAATDTTLRSCLAVRHACNVDVWIRDIAAHPDPQTCRSNLNQLKSVPTSQNVDAMETVFID